MIFDFLFSQAYRLIRRQPESLICIGFIICLLSQADPVIAYDYRSEGIKLFQQGQYKQACQVLRIYSDANQTDAEAMYYYALALHYGGNRSEARDKYMRVIQTAPESPAAANSRKALAKLAPDLLTKLSQTATPQKTDGASLEVLTQALDKAKREQKAALLETRAKTGLDKIPDECRIYCQRTRNGHYILEAYLNGRPIKCMFDTGAEGNAFGKNHLKALGLTPPSGTPSGKSQGVGDGGAQDFWIMEADLKVGTIERKKIEISVQENLPTYPLIGQEFFEDFTYTIDNEASCIHLVRKSKKGGSIYAALNDTNSIPFTRYGKEMLVEVEVQGKKAQMYFDTGAAGVVFPAKQLDELGIKIPEDAYQGRSSGVAGSTNTKFFKVTSIKMGPISKSNFYISVPDGYAMPHGLVGQSLLNDYEYTVDYENSRIHFIRRH